MKVSFNNNIFVREPNESISLENLIPTIPDSITDLTDINPSRKTINYRAILHNVLLYTSISIIIGLCVANLYLVNMIFVTKTETFICWCLVFIASIICYIIFHYSIVHFLLDNVKGNNCLGGLVCVLYVAICFLLSMTIFYFYLIIEYISNNTVNINSD